MCANFTQTLHHDPAPTARFFSTRVVLTRYLTSFRKGTCESILKYLRTNFALFFKREDSTNNTINTTKLIN